MMRRRFLAGAIIAAVMVLGSANRADATFQLLLRQDGVDLGSGVGAAHVVQSGADFSNISVTGTFGDFTVEVFGGSSNNGLVGGTLSNLLHSTTSVTNNSTESRTLELWIVQNNYTLPLGDKLFVSSSLGGTITNGTIELDGIYQAFADENNSATPGAGSFTNGSQNANQTGMSYDTGTVTNQFMRPNPTYALSSFVSFGMSGGAIANFSSSVAVRPVPAPAGLILAATAVPFLGLMRRRMRKAEPTTAA